MFIPGSCLPEVGRFAIEWVFFVLCVGGRGRRAQSPRVAAEMLMNTLRLFYALLVVFFWVTTIRAVNIETVLVGNPGNPPDMRYLSADHNLDGVGAVNYEYRIGKYEVTNAQYVEFLNSVDPMGGNTFAIYNGGMSAWVGGIDFSASSSEGEKYTVKPGRGNQPVSGVRGLDVMRFANWLHNGQGSGDTEDGAYTVRGLTSSFNITVSRNPGARWFLPSEDEWYKAAYHKNDGPSGNFWDFPTATDTMPYSDQPPGSDAPDPANTANFWKNDNLANGYDDGAAITGHSFVTELTDVGAYRFSVGPYGTFDQGGNVWELNEAKLHHDNYQVRGGSSETLGIELSADRLEDDRNARFIGFRVASRGIPEPGTLLLGVIAGVVFLLPRGRRA